MLGLVQSAQGEVLVAGHCSPKVGRLACEKGRELRLSAGELLSASRQIVNFKVVHFVLVFTRYTEVL